jgi:hypothetical protein
VNLIDKIAFAGIAIIWIFKKTEGQPSLLNSELILPAFLLAGSLAFDLLQYIYQSIFWCLFYRYHEKRNHKEALGKTAYNYPSWTFFWLKVILVIISYYFIFHFLYITLVRELYIS